MDGSEARAAPISRGVQPKASGKGTTGEQDARAFDMNGIEAVRATQAENSGGVDNSIDLREVLTLIRGAVLRDIADDRCCKPSSLSQHCVSCCDGIEGRAFRVPPAPMRDGGDDAEAGQRFGGRYEPIRKMAGQAQPLAIFVGL